MIIKFIPRTEEREHLLKWIESEWKDYSDPKFGDQRPLHDEFLKETGLELDGWWYNQVFQYWKRAQILGVDTPAGRQAIAKMWAAMSGLVESVIRVHGKLPKPGVSSGNIEKDWFW